MDSDAQNYRQFLDGDEAAFAALVDRYKDGLTLYLCSFVGSIFTAEELMEDTFVKLAVKQPRFQGRSSFKTFLFAIARNTALDHLRRAKRQKTVPLETAEHALCEQQSVEESYLKEEESIRLHRAMEGLNDAYRQVLFLRYFEDLSLDEIATVLHKRKKQVESLLYHAKRALRTILQQEEAQG